MDAGSLTPWLVWQAEYPRNAILTGTIETDFRGRLLVAPTDWASIRCGRHVRKGAPALGRLGVPIRPVCPPAVQRR